MKNWIIALLFMVRGVALASSNEPFFKVAVVGGGLSGLTAAYSLEKAGIDVGVFEARSRLGGRVLSVYLDGQIVELGGHSILDGGDAPTIHKLVDELGLKTEREELSLKASYFDGKNFHCIEDLVEGAALSLEQLKELAERCQTMREVFDLLFPEKGPLYSLLAQRLATYEGGTIDELSVTCYETLYHILKGGESSVYAQGKPFTIEAETVVGGNAQLPLALAEKVRSISLNHALKSVERLDSGHYLLSFQNGQRVRAEIIVLAVPCSVYESIQFSENVIPRRTLEEIKRVPYGKNAKILAAMEPAVQDKRLVVSDTALCYFTGKGRCLTFYYSKPYGVFSPAAILSRYQVDRSIFDKDDRQIALPKDTPHYATDVSYAKYDGAVGYSWASDRFARGSYSFMGAECEKVLEERIEIEGVQVKALFAPIAGSLYFAGEHATIDDEILGTMEAACESGERVAKLIQIKLARKSHNDLLPTKL